MSIYSRTQLQWRKSTRSCHNSECVEVASTTPAIAVRDSKLVAEKHYPILAVSNGQWVSFVAEIKSGTFSLRSTEVVGLPIQAAHHSAPTEQALTRLQSFMHGKV